MKKRKFKELQMKMKKKMMSKMTMRTKKKLIQLLKILLKARKMREPGAKGDKNPYK